MLHGNANPSTKIRVGALSFRPLLIKASGYYGMYFLDSLVATTLIY